MHRRTVLRSALALLVAPLLACSDSTAPLLDIDDVTYASSLDVDLDALTMLSGGVGYEDLEVGTGATAENGTVASVRYVGYLPTGTRFDGNDTPGDDLLPVLIGNATSETAVRTVPGFELGITGMRVGGRRKIVIPPALAYGREGARDSQGRQVIPGNTPIVFDVELVNVQ